MKPITAPKTSTGGHFSKILKIIIIVLVILFVCLYALYHIVFYGSILSSCIYTEETLPAPEGLKNMSFLLEHNIYLATGNNKTNCSPQLKNIKNELVSNEVDINNVIFGVGYFSNNGQTIEHLAQGKTFTIEKIVAETKHGLVTLSGTGPYYYLILKDNNGVIYDVGTTHLGGQPDEINLTYLDNGEKKLLSSEYINHIYGGYDLNWENSQIYVPYNYKGGDDINSPISIPFNYK